jgi:hypothetical protein
MPQPRPAQSFLHFIVPAALRSPQAPPHLKAVTHKKVALLMRRSASRFRETVGQLPLVRPGGRNRSQHRPPGPPCCCRGRIACAGPISATPLRTVGVARFLVPVLDSRGGGSGSSGCGPGRGRRGRQFRRRRFRLKRGGSGADKDEGGITHLSHLPLSAVAAEAVAAANRLRRRRKRRQQGRCRTVRRLLPSTLTRQPTLCLSRSLSLSHRLNSLLPQVGR